MHAFCIFSTLHIIIEIETAAILNILYILHINIKACAIKAYTETCATRHLY